MRKSLALMLVLFILTALFLITPTRHCRAQTYRSVTIDEYGRITPKDAPVQHIEDTYILNGDVNRLVISISNIVVEGNGYTVTAIGGTMAVELGSVSNITLKNLNVTKSHIGISLDLSSNCTLTNNTITGANVYPPFEARLAEYTFGAEAHTW